MYFKNRQEAGTKLAAELEHLRYQSTAVLALSQGAVVVGEQIARALHGTLSLLLTEAIQLPDTGDEVIGLIDQSGYFTHNTTTSSGTTGEYINEMSSAIEEKKMQKLSQMNRQTDVGNAVDPHVFYGHQVIIVSDGLKNDMSFDAAINFLKVIRTDKLIAATPIASVQVLDKLRLMCDEVHVLSAIDNYFDTNHYYEDNTLPDTKSILDSLKGIINQWQ